MGNPERAPYYSMLVLSRCVLILALIYTNVCSYSKISYLVNDFSEAQWTTGQRYQSSSSQRWTEVRPAEAEAEKETETAKATGSRKAHASEKSQAPI